MKLLIVIPAYNEAQNLPKVLDDLRAFAPDTDALVIDDASQDDTAQVAQAGGVRCLRHPVNQGVAEAVRSGMRAALQGGYDAALQFDADGQHMACYIPQFMEAAQSMGTSATCPGIVIGSRYLDGSREPEVLKQLAKNIIQRTIRRRTGLSISDPTSGMRLFGAPALEYFANSDNPAPEADSVANLLATGMPWTEVPITIRPRTVGSSYLSGLKGLRYTFRMCRAIKRP